MGFDMYLYKTKRINGINAKTICDIDEYFGYLNRPEKFKNYTFDDWSGQKEIPAPELRKKYLKEYTAKYFISDKDKEFPYKSIMQNIAYWRNAFQIYYWFQKNIQNGFNDGKFFEVSESDLSKLLNTCYRVKNNCKEWMNEQNTENKYVPLQSIICLSYFMKKINKWSKLDARIEEYKNKKIDCLINQEKEFARMILPTGRLSFDSEYNEFYLYNVNQTITMLDKILKETDFSKEIILFSCN